MRLRLIAPVILFLCIPLSSAWAGRIFGDIKMDGKPLPAGVPVTIHRPAAEKSKDTPPPQVDSTATDKFGSYKLSVKEEGKCTLKIVYEKQTVTLEVFSYKDPTRYDLILEKKDGKLSLRRK